MAREANLDHDESLNESQYEKLNFSVSEDSMNRSRKRKKKKPPRIIRRKVSYCPNTSSSSFNRSKRRSSEKTVLSHQYKKINSQLAQALNYVKVELAHAKEENLELNGEKLGLQTELATMRGQVDPHLVEQEVQRRLLEYVGPVKDCLNAALDNMVGLSDNLTQGLRLTTATSRMSRQNGSTVSSQNRNSSIGTPGASYMAPSSGSSFRMRNATNFPPPSTPNKEVPKSMVSPMVAGHTIKRPKIQLNRIAMLGGFGGIFVGANPNPVLPTPPQPEQPAEEEHEVEDEVEEEIEEEIGASPDTLRRNRFNLTIIGEESRVEDSPLPNSQPMERLDESDEDDGVEVLSGNVIDVDVHTPIVQNVRPSHPSLKSDRRARTSLAAGPDRRLALEIPGSSTEDPVQDVSIRRRSRTADNRRMSGVCHRLKAASLSPRMHSPIPKSRASSGALLRTSAGAFSRTSVGGISRTSVGGRSRSPTIAMSRSSANVLSRSPANVMSRSPASAVSRTPPGGLSRSPYVDMMKTARHPHVLLSDLLLSPNISSSRPSSTPVVLDIDNRDVIDNGEENEQDRNVFDLNNMPADPSDSFLERMCEENPLEGPSWLFATIKKKKGKRSKGKVTAARKLSTVLSSGSGGSSSARTTLSFDTSDISADRTTDESDVSGFVPGVNILDDDLERSIGVEETRLETVDMDETEVHGMRVDEGGEDKENVSGEGDEEFVMVDGERTPLKELVFMNGGVAVKYNPELETGVTVDSLKEAKILLDNIGVKGRRYSVEQDRRLSEGNSLHSARVRLSECYIDLSGGGACLVAPLDQMVNISGGGTPRGSVVRNVEEPGGGGGEESGKGSAVKKRKFSSFADGIIQEIDRDSKRSRKIDGGYKVGYSDSKNNSIEDVGESPGEALVRDDQLSERNDFVEERDFNKEDLGNKKRINERKSKAFIPAFIPFTPPRTKKVKEKTQRMPRSKAAAKLLEIDDENEENIVSEQTTSEPGSKTTAKLLEIDDENEENIVSEQTTTDVLGNVTEEAENGSSAGSVIEEVEKVSKEQVATSVETNQEIQVNDMEIDDEEFDFIESPLKTPKKKKKGKSTISRTRLSEFEILSPEPMKSNAHYAKSIIYSEKEPQLLMSNDNQEEINPPKNCNISDNETKSKKTSEETKETRIVSSPETSKRQASDNKINKDPLEMVIEANQLTKKSLTVSRNICVNSEVSCKLLNDSCSKYTDITSESSLSSTKSTEVEPEHLQLSIKSADFEPEPSCSSTKPKDIEPELSKKARARNASGNRQKAVSETFQAVQVEETMRRPRGRTTAVINYAELDDTLESVKKARARNPSGKKTKSIAENTNLNIENTKSNEETLIELERDKKSRSRNTSGEKINSGNKVKQGGMVLHSVDTSPVHTSGSNMVESNDTGLVEAVESSTETSNLNNARQSENSKSKTDQDKANSITSQEVTQVTTSEENDLTASKGSKKLEVQDEPIPNQLDSTKPSDNPEPKISKVIPKENKRASRKSNLDEKAATEEARDEGRGRRRAAASVSYKEPSGNKKLRQGDEHSASVYANFVPQTKGRKKK